MHTRFFIHICHFATPVLLISRRLPDMNIRRFILGFLRNEWFWFFDKASEWILILKITKLTLSLIKIRRCLLFTINFFWRYFFKLTLLKLRCFLKNIKIIISHARHIICRGHWSNIIYTCRRFFYFYVICKNCRLFVLNDWKLFSVNYFINLYIF